MSKSRVVLTGGAGDLGLWLSRHLTGAGTDVLSLDIVPPRAAHGRYVPCDIRKRHALEPHLSGADCVVHIAAWHGIHQFRGEKDVYDFWDLNVTGTFEVFEAVARCGVKRVVYLSSESVSDRDGIYGHSKVLGEEIARTYAGRHQLGVLTLRPRAFIPHWNLGVYRDFVEWARWFWKGAVHIDDVGAAVVASMEFLASAQACHHVLTIDGRYDYTPQDLEQWDAAGPGSTFAKYYGSHRALVAQHGLDPTLAPTVLGSAAAERLIGYRARYSLGSLLEELSRWGAAGPPSPFD